MTEIAAQKTQPTIDVLTQDEIDQKAWKYTGYPGFADFVSSDADFFVLRRFDRLNARVLLTLQDQLSALEAQLDEIDAKYSAKHAKDVDNGTCRADQPDRAAIIAQISIKLREYSKVIKYHSDLRAHPNAPKTDIKNVQNWFHNNEGAISEPEQAFIAHNDLISVIRFEKASIRHFFERRMAFRMQCFWKKKEVPTLSEADAKTRQYSSDERIDVYTTITVFVVALFMLIAPLWILDVVSGTYGKLGVITGFVIVFLGVLCWATVAKPFETLAATAAYSAVLMVFLQLGNGKS